MMIDSYDGLDIYLDSLTLPLGPFHKDLVLKAKTFALGEWYSCRGLAIVANSGK